MLLPEFKKFVKDLDREELEGVAALLYKRLSKAGKEGADFAIEDYLVEVKEAREAKQKKGKETLSFAQWKAQLEEFLDDVRYDRYIYVNDKVPPREQKKWKSKIKSFFKAMEEASEDRENAQDAFRLYSSLLILVNDCNTGEEFHLPAKYAWHSLGLSQLKSLQTLIQMYFAMVPSEENMAILLNTMADCEFSCVDESGFTEEVLDACGEKGVLDMVTRAGKKECERLNELAEENKNGFMGFVFDELSKRVNMAVKGARKWKPSGEV